MSANTFNCPIWGDGYLAQGYYKHQNRTFYVDDSPRAAGGYILPEETKHAQVDNLSPEQKARLTTWLIDQSLQGDKQPLINETIIEYVKVKPPLALHHRIDRLLWFVGEQTTIAGTSFDIRKDDGAAYAWSESTTEGEIGYLIDYLVKKGWLDSRPRVITKEFGEYEIPALFRVTVDGRNRIAEQITNVDSSQAFVAMWFNETMEEAFEQGIRPAIEVTGYNVLRIDQKEHINKIDDEIIAEIRRSRFVVADFTQGSDGARGGVYYEAGFAHGLGLQVIFTCREDSVDTLHFDTSHYNHIVWSNPTDLWEKLKNRILAVIGEGPAGLNNS